MQAAQFRFNLGGHIRDARSFEGLSHTKDIRVTWHC
jgi:hypothetical protein